MHYFAIVERDETGAYLATLPDLPGCTAHAASWLQLDGAIRHAVREHVAGRGEAAPPPTPIEHFSEDSAPPNSCWMQVALFAHELQPPPREVRRRARPAPSATASTHADRRAGSALAASP